MVTTVKNPSNEATGLDAHGKVMALARGSTSVVAALSKNDQMFNSVIAAVGTATPLIQGARLPVAPQQEVKMNIANALDSQKAQEAFFENAQRALLTLPKFSPQAAGRDAFGALEIAGLGGHELGTPLPPAFKEAAIAEIEAPLNTPAVSDGGVFMGPRHA